MRERSRIVKHYFRPPTDLPPWVSKKNPVRSRRLKPYTPLDMKVEAMTIAAGFKCQDGVVLCADTEMSVPYLLKYPASKMTIVPFLKSKAFFTYAGDELFSKMCIARLAARLRRLEGDDGLPVFTSLQQEALAIHQEYAGVLETPLQVLIALQGYEKVDLYQINEHSVAWVSSYTCIGSGMMVARASAEPLYKVSMSVKEVSFVAAYALGQAKKYGFGCGSQSQIVLIYPRKGDPRFFTDEHYDFMLQAEVERLEKGYEAITSALRALLLKRGSVFPKKDVAFEKSIKALVRTLRNEGRRRGTLVGLYEQQNIERDIASQEELYEEQQSEDESV